MTQFDPALKLRFSIRTRPSTCCEFHQIDAGLQSLGIQGAGCIPIFACSEPTRRRRGMICNSTATRAPSLLWSLDRIEQAYTRDVKAKR